MLESVRLENFRAFDDHLVPLRQMTVIVGINNAGKSTLVEALRLAAAVVARFRRGTGHFVGIPDWLEDPRAHRGVSPSRRGLAFEGYGPSTFHQYNGPPAVITAQFTSGASVTVFIGPDGELHGVARSPDGAAVGTAGEAKALGFTAIAIQPQVTPLLREEKILADETIRRGDGTYLAPQHFRNQLSYFADSYERFCALAEQTWPGLAIVRLEANAYHPDDPIQLDVRDAAFVGEVGLMGHGLQMWLQTIWFLARTDPEATVVLDEPDVYMHPDLHRRLLDLVRPRFAQLLIATHSIEIVSDVEPEQLLSIERNQSESSFLTTLPGVQHMIDGLGGVHNIQVARLFRSRAFLLVEGEDIRLLRILQSVAVPNAPPIDLVPNGEIGGRGGWRSGVVARLPKRNIAGEKIVSYCLLDRDYFPDDEILERYEEARQWGVNLRIWSRKELENYLLVPEAISRLIGARVADGVAPPDADAIATEIDKIVESMRDDPITESITKILYDRNKKAGVPKAMSRSRKFVARRWGSRDDRWAIAPGKEVISRLSGWSKDAFDVSFGPEQIARTLEVSEIDPELEEVLRAIPSGKLLRPPKSPNA